MMLARRLARSYPEIYEDAVQDGVIGLLKGIERHRLDEDVRLWTSLQWSVRHDINECVHRSGKTIVRPTDQEVFQKPENRARLYVVSLDCDRWERGEKVPPDVILATQDTTFWKQAKLRQQLSPVFGVLTPWEHYVVERIFGLNRARATTLTSLARELGYAHKTVWRDYRRALSKMGLVAMGEDVETASDVTFMMTDENNRRRYLKQMWVYKDPQGDVLILLAKKDNPDILALYRYKDRTWVRIWRPVATVREFSRPFFWDLSEEWKQRIRRFVNRHKHELQITTQRMEKRSAASSGT
tara:strand:- start:204 stop:1097 length:894 start_codon:yes stop_codon:yes gene_type:complete